MPTYVTQNSTIKYSQIFFAWIVWGLSCVFYFYESLLQMSLSVMGTELMRDFAITSQTLGFLSGIYYYSYSPMQLPCGVMLDYFGPRRILTIATFICAISTLAFAMTGSIYMACLARLMIGFGSSFAAVGAMKLAATWFPPTRFAFLTGLMVTVGMIGAISGEGPLALMIEQFGWRKSMIIMGIIGLIIATLIMVIIKDAPKKNDLPTQSTNEPPLLSSLLTIISNKQLWLVAIYGGLMYMVTPVFCGLWGVPFLMLKLHITKATAANYVSLVFIGWAIASPLWGIYSNRIGLRKPPLYIGVIGALCTSILFIYAPIESDFVIEVLLFAFGVFSAGFLCAFSVAKELCSSKHVATGLGFMNMLNMLGIAIAQPFIGSILDKFWTGNMINNVREYSLFAYHVGLSILPLGMFVAFLIVFFIKETYCRQCMDVEAPPIAK